MKLPIVILVLGLCNLHSHASPIPQDFENRDSFDDEDDQLTTVDPSPDPRDFLSEDSSTTKFDEPASFTIPYPTSSVPELQDNHHDDDNATTSFPVYADTTTVINTASDLDSETTPDYDEHVSTPDPNSSEIDDDQGNSNNKNYGGIDPIDPVDPNGNVDEDNDYDSPSNNPVAVIPSLDPGINPITHDNHKNHIELGTNRVNLDLNIHIREDADYFNQIIEKFKKVDASLKELKKEYTNEKAWAKRRFTEVKYTIDRKEIAHTQRQQQISESIKRNEQLIRTNESQKKQDKSGDKQQSVQMSTGFTKQVAGMDRSFKQNMDQFNDKMRPYLENL